MSTVEFTIYVPDTVDELLALIDEGRIEAEAYVRNGWWKLGPRQSLGRRPGRIAALGNQHHTFTWEITDISGHLEREIEIHHEGRTYNGNLDCPKLPYLARGDSLVVTASIDVIPR